jgi:hypothetical protein
LTQEYEFAQLKAAGVPNIALLSGMDFFGEDTLGTTDGSEPSDLGSLRMAEAVRSALHQRG